MYLDIISIQRVWIQYMEFFLQIFAWGWLYNISNLEIFAPCAQQIGRSHPRKQMSAVKQLFEQNQELKAQLFKQNREFMEQLLHITDMENQELQTDTIRADLIQAVALIQDLPG